MSRTVVPSLWLLALSGLLASAASPASGAVAKPEGIIWDPSPNYSFRNPAGVDSIVMHTTEGSHAGAVSWLTNPASNVSAHFVISPTGDIHQLVDTDNKAWHATYYNTRSIGIEMSGFANQRDTWTRANLSALYDLSAWLVDAYDIPIVHPDGNAYDFIGNRYDEAGLIAHGQVQPWNRTDPGPYFRWDTYVSQVQQRVNAAIPEPGTAVILLAGAAGLALRRRRA